MKVLLGVAHGIDRVNEWLGRIAVWAAFISCMIAAINATFRYLFDSSSNAWLEVQWYLFAVTVMLGAAWVLKLNEHVRVDILYGARRGRTKAAIDLFGLIIFLMPAAVLMTWMSWPWVVEAFHSGEVSGNAGGLIRWPVKAMIPFGFLMLALQGVAEIIKRIAFLMGVYPMDTQYERPLQ